MWSFSDRKESVLYFLFDQMFWIYITFFFFLLFEWRCNSFYFSLNHFYSFFKVCPRRSCFLQSYRFWLSSVCFYLFKLKNNGIFRLSYSSSPLISPIILADLLVWRHSHMSAGYLHQFLWDKINVFLFIIFSF